LIIVQTPLRISFFGGGTDFRAFFMQEGGCVLSSAIDKYIFVTIKQRFDSKLRIGYTQTEMVDEVDQIHHELIRESLRLTRIDRGIEITTMGDIPSEGSGLGSSSTVTVGALHAMYAYLGEMVPAERLAREACAIEIETLKRPIGIQDQYIAAYGGLTCFTFHKDGRVEAEPLKLPIDAMFNLEDNLLLFFTGFSRSASSILADQQRRTAEHDAEMLRSLHHVKGLGIRSRAALEKGDTTAFGELMHEHWEHKKRRSGGMTSAQIDEWYDLGRRNGAIGGKLVGAGGGGFLMFYTEDHRRLRSAMAGAGLEEIRFRFDFEGTKVLFA